MARIRTVKPEFWEDEVVGIISRDARLLFIATWNLADDEGLLRWTPSYIKSSVFMYDDDIGADGACELMNELVKANLIFPYRGGKALQQLAVIPNFRRHQRINRPQPSKLPAPSLQNLAVRQMYARRDGWTCHLCQQPIPERPVTNTVRNLSIDHLVPRSAAGHDYPSNVKVAHEGCNKSRGARDIDDFARPDGENGPPGAVQGSVTHSVNDSMNGSMGDSVSPQSVVEPSDSIAERSENSLNDSVNDAVTDSPPEGKGREGKGKGKGVPPTAGAASPHTENGGNDANQTNVQRIIGAYIDGASGAGLGRPSGNLPDRVGRDAKRLLGEGVPLADLEAAATAMGAAGWHDLAVQLQRNAADRNGRASPKAFKNYDDQSRYDRPLFRTESG